MKICGPKLSLCCSIISVWGIVQLAFMALFFGIKSPAFIEDLSIPEEAHHDARTFLTAMEDSYALIAKNCGIAAALYAVTLAVSGWQMWVNNKS